MPKYPLCYHYKTNKFETTFYCSSLGLRPDGGWRPNVTVPASEIHDEIVKRLCAMFADMGIAQYNGPDSGY
jgi:hypothetical protein